jgi:DNA polymerase-3 subunit beta
MKFTAKKKDFLTAVKNSAACISSKNILPIIGTILIKTTEDGKISITGTNLETRIEYNFEPVKTETGGEACINAKKLLTALSAFGGMDVCFEEINKGFYTLSSDTAKIELPGMDAKDYPDFVFEDNGKKEILFDAVDLNNGIKNTSFAVATDDSRKVLNGVLFCADEKMKEIKIVATDGKRLAISTVNNENITEDFAVVIPQQALSYIKNFTTGKLNITITYKVIVIKNDSLKLYSKLIEGNYPNYKQVIPADLPNVAVIKTADLAAKIKVATVVNDATENTVFMSFDGAYLKLSASSSNGKSQDKMPCEVEGIKNPVNLAFNAQFILDALNAGETIALHFDTNGIAPVKMDSANMEYIIMPIRKK